MLVSAIHTKCDSDFHILINVIGYAPDLGGKYEIKDVKFFDINSPEGYRMPYFSNLFEQEREFRYRFEAEETERKNRRAEAKKETSRKTEYLDPCAPGIPSSVRCERLKQFGKVRQTGPNDYEAGGHQVSLSPFDENTLIYCR